MTDIEEHGRTDIQEHERVVREFYRAVGEKDAAAIEALVPARFADDVAMIWPDSLPYGGRVAGAARLTKMFARMLSSPVPVGVADIVVAGVVVGGERVAAQLEFDWYAPGSSAPIRTGALELWTFADGLVREIRAYYWDTAACVSATTATHS